MAKDILIRPAGLLDASAVAELCTQLGYPTSPEQAARRVDQIARLPDHGLFVAVADGQVVGWVHVHAYPLPEVDTHAELGGLVVDERVRNGGIGRMLVEQAESWSRGQGCGFLSVRSNIVREAAHRFYQRLGFEQFKTQYSFRKQL